MKYEFGTVIADNDHEASQLINNPFASKESKILGIVSRKVGTPVFPNLDHQELIDRIAHLETVIIWKVEHFEQKAKELPIDLSLNNETLKNYAQIIQAFSRESLNVNKSESLQSFLFGNDKEKELRDKFYETIEELNDDAKQFESNIEQIDLLTRKQIQLSELLNLKTAKEEAHKDFLIASYSYYNQLLKEKLNKIEVKINEYNQSVHSLPILKTTIENKLTSIDEEIEELEPKYLDALRTKDSWNTKNSKRKKFLLWMQELKSSAEEVVEKYNKYQTSKDAIEKVNQLEQKLKSKNIFTTFQSDAYSGKNILIQIEKQIETLKQELEIKNKLKSLNNIDNKYSLVHWVLNLKNELNLQQEAIIRKYQNEDIQVQEPSEKSKKYIPLPKELIENLIPYKNEKDGFWLKLNGVVEFFSTDFQQVFNTKNTDEIKKYFQQETKSILNDIAVLKKNITEKITLQNVFEELENPDDYLLAWNSQLDFSEQLQAHEMYDLEKDDFAEHYNLFLQDSV